MNCLSAFNKALTKSFSISYIPLKILVAVDKVLNTDEESISGDDMKKDSFSWLLIVLMIIGIIIMLLALFGVF